MSTSFLTTEEKNMSPSSQYKRQTQGSITSEPEKHPNTIEPNRSKAKEPPTSRHLPWRPPDESRDGLIRSAWKQNTGITTEQFMADQGHEIPRFFNTPIARSTGISKRLLTTMSSHVTNSDARILQNKLDHVSPHYWRATRY